MITRGYIVGKIVDDLTTLQIQIETRNQLGFFDLAKVCEDFAKELLNLTYKYNLVNLNKLRRNNPGLDLGDKNANISFQVTSQNTSQKINKTLVAVNDDQLETYKNIKIFILGKKLPTYKKIEEKQIKRCSFNIVDDIIDLNDVLRDIVLLNVEELDPIFELFKRDFRQVRIELEPIDKNGNYDSSLYNHLEKKVNLPPMNSKKLEDYFYDYQDHKSILKSYKKLTNVPRYSRELLAVIAERGKILPGGSRYSILPHKLARILRLNEDDLIRDVSILEDEDLVQYSPDLLNDREVYYLEIRDDGVNSVLSWAIEQEFSLKLLLNTMDFSVLDE